MSALEASVELARPVSEVWDYIARPENLSVWVLGVDEATQVTDGPLAVGTRWRGTFAFLGLGFPLLVECTNCEVNKAVGFKSVEGKLAFSAETTLEKLDDVTRFTYRVRSETGFARVFGKLTGLITAKASSRVLRASLRNLADVLATGG